MSIKIEICAATKRSAFNAQIGGADRIEFCKSLEVGGLTPDLTTFIEVRKQVTIPIYILIRPRAGDFVYSDQEHKDMIRQINLFKAEGCHGIVAGTLRQDHNIDLKKTESLVAVAHPLPFTFHKAIDDVRDPHNAIQSLSQIGVQTILTSGQKEDALAGLETLISWNAKYGADITIMPGGGIRSKDIHLWRNSKFKIVHSAAKSAIDRHSSLDEVKRLVQDIKPSN